MIRIFRIYRGFIRLKLIANYALFLRKSYAFKQPGKLLVFALTLFLVLHSVTKIFELSDISKSAFTHGHCGIPNVQFLWPPEISVMPEKTIVLVHNRNTSETIDFVQHFCGTYLSPKDNVTLFIFSPPNEPKAALHGKTGRCSIVNKNSKRFFNNQLPYYRINKCDAYLFLRGSIQNGSFDFVFFFDTSVQFTNPFSIKTAMRGVELLTFAHKSLILKNGRWSNSAIIYSSKAFGGVPSAIGNICHKLTSKDPNFHFQKSFNKHFHSNPPTRTILIESDVVCNYLWGQNIFIWTTPPFVFKDQEESNYWKLLEVLEERETEEKQQNLVDIIVKDIKRNYLPGVRKMMRSSSSDVKFVTAQCKFPKDQCMDKFFVPPITVFRNPRVLWNCKWKDKLSCNGFGDRLRGTIVAFYLALAMNRAVNLAWEDYADPLLFFEMNSNFYGVDETFYNSSLQLITADQTKWILHNGGVPDSYLIAKFSGDGLSGQLDEYRNINFMSNRYAGLEGLFSNQELRQRLHHVLPHLKYPIINYVPLLSAALRVIFSKTTDKFQGIFDKVIEQSVGWSFWKNSIKIGVQIRTEITETTVGRRVNPAEITTCIVGEIQRIIKLKVRNPLLNKTSKPITIFVTSDWRFSFASINATIDGKIPDMKLFSTGQSSFKLNSTHMAFGYRKNQDAWHYSLKTYLDWYFLTKMDYLIISRSGYGESAALLSLKPTRRFLHHPSRHAGKCLFEDYAERLPVLAKTSEVAMDDLL